jgi:phosphoribosylanthranilate isomerase
MIRLKICGLIRSEDACISAEAGADAIGMIFYEGSPRAVTTEQARSIVHDLPPYVARVGVFVNEDQDAVRRIADDVQLDVLQFHGDESPEYCAAFDRRTVKVFRVKDALPFDEMRRYTVDAWQLDTKADSVYGGTGETFDWSIVQQAKTLGPVVLSGGVTEENMREALLTVQPYAVDLSSGVESAPGIKDRQKILAVSRIIQTCNAELLS